MEVTFAILKRENVDDVKVSQNYIPNQKYPRECDCRYCPKRSDPEPRENSQGVSQITSFSSTHGFSPLVQEQTGTPELASLLS